MAIHPSAKVHPTAVIEGDVAIAADVVVGAFCFLRGPLSIGEGTKIYPHCVIGMEAEYRTKEANTPIHIGARNVIRELSAIQRGTGDRDTTIGDHCYLMGRSHVCHDVLIEDWVTMAPNVVLAGHVKVLHGANIGIGSKVHQFSTVGAYVMVGMGSIVIKDVPPLCLVVGNPAKFKRFNTHVFKTNGFTEDSVAIVDGKLTTKSAAIQKLIDSFHSFSKRKILSLPVST